MWVMMRVDVHLDECVGMHFKEFPLISIKNSTKKNNIVVNLVLKKLWAKQKAFIYF